MPLKALKFKVCKLQSKMQKIQVHTEIDIKAFVAQLGDKELKAFLREISALLAQRSVPDREAREAALLLKLNEDCALSQEHWEQFHTLTAKQEEGALSPSEQAAFLALSKAEERARLQRIQILGELAQLRGRTLHEVAEELGITDVER